MGFFKKITVPQIVLARGGTLNDFKNEYSSKEEGLFSIAKIASLWWRYFCHGKRFTTKALIVGGSIFTRLKILKKKKTIS